MAVTRMKDLLKKLNYNMIEFDKHRVEMKALIDAVQNDEEFQKIVGKDGIGLLKEYFKNGLDQTRHFDSRASKGLKKFSEFGRLLNTPRRTHTFYQAFKEAAMRHGVDENHFRDTLSYFDQTLELELGMRSLDPGFEKKPAVKPPFSWREYNRYLKESTIPPNMLDAYRQAGRENDFYQDRAESLAARMACNFKIFQTEKHPDRDTRQPSLSRAEKYTQQIKDTPLFKHIAKDPLKVAKLLDSKKQIHEKLTDAAISMYRPFYTTPEAKRKEVLSKLKKMLPNMDRANGRSKEWRKLIESIQSADLNDPARCNETKLQEIFDNAEAYMKGKKSLRGDQEKQNRFDQAMDVVAVLAEASQFAHWNAERLVDRTNEVRVGHDANYQKIKLENFGRSQLGRHTNPALQIDPNAKIELLKRMVTDKMPEDPQDLEPAKFTNKMSLSSVRLVLPEFKPGREPSANDKVTAVAGLLALTEMQACYNPNAPIASARIVMDGNRLAQKLLQYQNDPAVAKMAESLDIPAYEAMRQDFTKISAQALKTQYQDAKKSIGPQMGL